MSIELWEKERGWRFHLSRAFDMERYKGAVLVSAEVSGNIFVVDY